MIYFEEGGRLELLKIEHSWGQGLYSLLEDAPTVPLLVL